MGILTIIARILFSMLFLMSGVNHFMQLNNMAQYAASKGVKGAKLATAVTGLMLLLGGLSFLFNSQVKIGAILLIIFLIPTAIIMHNFWKAEDTMTQMNEMAHFMKDLALAGAAFLIAFA